MGIQFKRLDVLGSIITASWKNASDIVLSTKIWSDDKKISISTIEHFMASFSAFGIDDALVEVSCDELPILDGSCLDIVRNIQSVGIQETHLPRHYIEVLKKVEVTMGDKNAKLEPARKFIVNFGIEFPTAHIGVSIFQEDITPEGFLNMAHARTFIMEENLEISRKMGKMIGASIDTMIIVGVDGIHNHGGLRMQDEFARHKALDAIGDLYLAESPIIGKFTGWKAGHLLNNMALVALMSDNTAWRYVDKVGNPVHAIEKKRVSSIA
jgi:UDP-3-O-[3-hydroxymyristoyl] N-acetylglucosamine deacetylase